MEHKYYLLTYNDSWADEIDIDGFTVFDEEGYTQFQRALKNCQGFTMYIGSNEEIEYYSNREVRNTFTVTEITEAQFNVLNDISLLSMGYAERFVENVLECFDEEAEEIEYEEDTYYCDNCEEVMKITSDEGVSVCPSCGCNESLEETSEKLSEDATLADNWTHDHEEEGCGATYSVLSECPIEYCPSCGCQNG